jgi:6-phosphogluconolactonase
MAQTDMNDTHHWHIHPDPAAVAQAAADYLAERIWAVLDDLDSCHIALPGGTTPAACLRLLAAMPLPWPRIHWYLGDERCLPVGDPERNDSLIRDCLWDPAAIPDDNRHPIRAELGASTAAMDYSELLAQLGHLDIVLLGMGEDGHTASLFPGNPALALTDAAVPVANAPKPPPDRVSLSIPTLQAASLRIALITGAGKAEAVQQLKAGVPLPINQVGALEIFADRAATG